jgi:hypothetical protein
MAAQFKIRNVNEVLAKISGILKDAAHSQKVLNDSGKFFVERIKAFTRSGKSLALGGSKLRDLADITIEFRKEYKKAGGLVHETFRPQKSQLTVTGQMLDAVKYEIDGTKINVFVEGTKRDPNLPAGDKTNAELAQENADLGRPFLGVDERGLKRMKLMIVEEIRRISRQRGFTK